SASLRTMAHFLDSLRCGADIATAPYKILKEWGESGMPIPDDNKNAKSSALSLIPYQNLNINQSWREYDLHHELTNKGLEKFATDWNNLIKN
ncbi:MAG: transaldolase, partial [Patescibacteria group bacterium]